MRIKRLHIVVSSVLLTVIIIGYLIYCYFYVPIQLIPRDEKLLYTQWNTEGLAWDIIDSEKRAAAYNEDYGVTLPANNYSENYLLVSHGRRVKKITFTRISRYDWHYDVPIGKEEFFGPVLPHTFFVYKIDRYHARREID